MKFKNKFEKSESWCPDIFMITKIIIIILLKKAHKQMKKPNKQKPPKNLPLEMKLVVRSIL